MNDVPSLVRAIDTLNRMAEPRVAATRPLTSPRPTVRRPGGIAGARPAGADRRSFRAWSKGDPPSGRRMKRRWLPSTDARCRVGFGAARGGARVLSDAVALRAFAQERPWFDGDFASYGGGHHRGIRARSAHVRANGAGAWRGYYSRNRSQTLCTTCSASFPRCRSPGLHLRFGNRSAAGFGARRCTIPARERSSFPISRPPARSRTSCRTTWIGKPRDALRQRPAATAPTARCVTAADALAASVRGLGEARVVRWFTGLPSSPSNERPVETLRAKRGLVRRLDAGLGGPIERFLDGRRGSDACRVRSRRAGCRGNGGRDVAARRDRSR